MRRVFAFDYWPASHGRLSPTIANAIADLIERRGGLSDHLLLDFQQAVHGHPAQGYIGVTVRDASDSGTALQAYAQISAGNGTDLIETITVEPSDRDAAESGLAGSALDAAIDAQSLYHPGLPALWWTDTNAESDRLADERRLVRRRLLHQMTIDLPARSSATIATRSFDPGDTEDWLRVNNAAFADHSEQGSWTRAMFEQRQSEQWFDPSGLRVAEIDGEMVGFCWTKIHPAANRTTGDVGEIYVIAVHPDHAGQGLGTELVLAGLDAMDASGVSEAMLYVDGDNSRALAMYDRLGFSIGRSRSAYETTRR